MDDQEKMSRPEATGPHEMSLTNRNRLVMTGVNDVISFNDKQVHLETVQGPCMISGEELNIKQLNLDQGELRVEGNITSIDYNAKGSKNFINRVFK